MKISFELWFESYLGNTGVWYKSVESNTGSPIFEQELEFFHSVKWSTIINIQRFTAAFNLSESWWKSKGKRESRFFLIFFHYSRIFSVTPHVNDKCTQWGQTLAVIIVTWIWQFPLTQFLMKKDANQISLKSYKRYAPIILNKQKEI